VRRLLWVGDAVVATGFAKSTHKTLATLMESWEVHVLGINYVGDPHTWPYPIYPCWPGGDDFGVRRMAQMCGAIKPDLVVLQNDPWNVPQYLQQIPREIPVVASMPVDGNNCVLGRGIERLREASAKDPTIKSATELAGAIFWTRFGEEQARNGGYDGPSWIVPLGVDLTLFGPVDRAVARERAIGRDANGAPLLPEDAFIVGNVNRNQPRKRLDLTVEYFCEWVRSRGLTNAYLSLFVAPTGDNGYDVKQLMKYYGFSGDHSKRLILTEPHIGFGVPEGYLPSIYSSFDVQISTTQGEGWGLTTMEGMACGIPQVFPDWSALGEWAKPAGIAVPCRTFSVTPGRINVVGGCPAKEETVAALNLLYDSREERERLRVAGLELVRRPEYRWPAIGRAFGAALDAVMAGRT
jgi:D-inositol-3-phosphate glycosyltransferase